MSFPKELRAVDSYDEYGSRRTFLYFIDTDGYLNYYESPKGGKDSFKVPPYKPTSISLKSGETAKSATENPTFGVLTSPIDDGANSTDCKPKCGGDDKNKRETVETRIYYRDETGRLKEIRWIPGGSDGLWDEGGLTPQEVRLNPETSITAVHASGQFKVFCTLEGQNWPMVYWSEDGNVWQTRPVKSKN